MYIINKLQVHRYMTIRTLYYTRYFISRGPTLAEIMYSIQDLKYSLISN